MDMGFSVKRSGNFLHRDLSMKKDSHCLKPFSSEQCFAKVLPHPFFLCVHILGYSIKITPSSLEMSNVDLADQFSDMIITQRGFQSNSKIITVGDEMLETLINMKR